MVKISSIDREDIWKYLYHIQTLISNYETYFGERRKNLYDKQKEIKLLIKKDKQDKIKLNELKNFCRDEWKNIIIKTIVEIRDEINTRKTKGVEFSDILIQLEYLEESTVTAEDYALEWYENIFVDDLIKGQRQKTKEKIDIEKFNNQRYHDGLWLGGLIGLVVGFIGGVILYLVGFA